MIDQVARTAPAARDIPLVRAAHAEYLQCLSKIDGHLKQTGAAFIVGDDLSIGDVPLAVSISLSCLPLPIPVLPDRAGAVDWLVCCGHGLSTAPDLTCPTYVLCINTCVRTELPQVELNRWALCVHRARSDGIVLQVCGSLSLSLSRARALALTL